MDQANRLRLEMHQASLTEIVSKAEALIKEFEDTGAEVRELYKTKHRLKDAIANLKNEIWHTIDKSPNESSEIIKTFTELELNANKTASDIASMIALHENMIRTDQLPSPHSMNTQTAKLPKLQLPTFEGNILKWHDFWDQFEASIHKAELSEAVKMAYLVASLKGPALQAIEGLGPTNKNYSIALDTLKQRFGDNRRLIDAHYEALLKTDIAQDNPRDCRRVLNSIERDIRILQSLGEDPNNNAFRTTLISKFPEKIIFQLNLSTQQDDSVKTIRETLNTIITALEQSTRPSIGEDHLQLKFKEDAFDLDKLTSSNKREVLRTIASIYDPCGYVAPLVMPAKQLLQNLWLKKYKWETSLPENLLTQWKEIVHNLQDIKNIILPRHVGPNIIEDGAKYQLHCFTDASQNSYAAVAYLRVEDTNSVKISLLMSKARIAPLKDRENLKIPKLELMGYLIGKRLLSYLVETIGIPNTEQFLWTDSLVVLSWMESKKLLPPFVARRVEEIKKGTEIQRCYIQTEQNPADIATRPETWTKRKDLWFHGPPFLSTSENVWPRSIHLDSHRVSLALMVEGLDSVQHVTDDDAEINTNPDDIQSSGEKYSETDLPDNRVQSQSSANIKGTTSPITTAQNQEITKLQATHFPEEYKGKITHLARNLGLFKDVDGLLRSKGRLTNADLSYDMKHPILLPRGCEFTRKVIMNAHEKNYHVGTSHTLSVVREQYWIPQGRQEVKQVISKCGQCRKHGGGPYQLPATPALPIERVNYASPFTYTGTDYFGPMYISTEDGKGKRWICLFTCLIIRAIHLEVVKDLTAEEFLLALRRFIAARNKPSLIMSDNALQFKLTSEVLYEYGKQNEIKWKFIPQLAPWYGAVYERLIGIVKNCLKRTLEKHLLNDSQLLTIMKEVEAVINTRPLTYVGDEVLRPVDFLSLGECISLNFDDDKIRTSNTVTKENLIEGWKRGHKVVNEFKNMFIRQYLLNLRERYKHLPKQNRVRSQQIPSVGDIVQIKGELKNRELWKVGRIVEIIKGSDGEIRVAKVKVGDAVYTRSISHLYPLETEILQTETLNDTLDTPSISTLPPPPEISSNTQDNVNDEDVLREEEIAISEDTERAVGQQYEKEIRVGLEDGILTEDMIPIISDNTIKDPITDTDTVSDNLSSTETKHKRDAAVRARRKIAEWTSQLFNIIS